MGNTLPFFTAAAVGALGGWEAAGTAVRASRAAVRAPAQSGGPGQSRARRVGLHLGRRRPATSGGLRFAQEAREECSSARVLHPTLGQTWPRESRGRHVRSRCRCSMCPAIHINSRSWLRSSSTHEPSDPPLRVVCQFFRRAVRPRLPRSQREHNCNSSTVIKTTGPPGRPRRPGVRRAHSSSGGSLNLAPELAPPRLKDRERVPFRAGVARYPGGKSQLGVRPPLEAPGGRALRPQGSPARRPVAAPSAAPQTGRPPAPLTPELARGWRPAPAGRAGHKRSLSVYGRDAMNVNDPSAGSPTETLLRLLLPLDDQV